jgi:hypothetical protein
LKNEQFNDQWKVSFVNQAQEQDVSAILDASYVSSPPIDTALFQEKQKYLYAVLEAKVEATKEKSIIQKNKSTYDAHKVEPTAPHDADNPQNHLIILPK